MTKFNKSQEAGQKKPVTAILSKMEVGDYEPYPISRYRSITNLASITGTLQNKRFTTALRKDVGIVIVTREA